MIPLSSRESDATAISLWENAKGAVGEGRTERSASFLDPTGARRWRARTDDASRGGGVLGKQRRGAGDKLGRPCQQLVKNSYDRHAHRTEHTFLLRLATSFGPR